MRKLNYPVKDIFDTNHMCEFLKPIELLHKNNNNTNLLDQTQNLKLQISQFEIINFHKNVAYSQRKAYNYQRTNFELLKTSILIDVDYKQKIIIGISPGQLSYEYYQQNKTGRLNFKQLSSP